MILLCWIQYISVISLTAATKSCRSSCTMPLNMSVNFQRILASWQIKSSSFRAKMRGWVLALLSIDCNQMKQWAPLLIWNLNLLKFVIEEDGKDPHTCKSVLLTKQRSNTRIMVNNIPYSLKLWWSPNNPRKFSLPCIVATWSVHLIFCVLDLVLPLSLHK